MDIWSSWTFGHLGHLVIMDIWTSWTFGHLGHHGQHGHHGHLVIIDIWTSWTFWTSSTFGHHGHLDIMDIWIFGHHWHLDILDTMDIWIWWIFGHFRDSCCFCSASHGECERILDTVQVLLSQLVSLSCSWNMTNQLSPPLGDTYSAGQSTIINWVRIPIHLGYTGP